MWLLSAVKWWSGSVYDSILTGPANKMPTFAAVPHSEEPAQHEQRRLSVRVQDVIR